MRTRCVAWIGSGLWLLSSLAGCGDDGGAAPGDGGDLVDGDRPDTAPFDGGETVDGDRPDAGPGDGAADAPRQDPDAGAGEPVFLNTETLCADPEAYDGRRVSISGTPGWMGGHGTAVGCDCCNVGIRPIGYRCDPDRAMESESAIVLVPASEGEWEEVAGEPVLAELLDVRELLLDEARTTLGCAGQACFETCTPALPRDIARVTGIFRLGSVESPGTGGFTAPFERSIAVEAVELRERYDGGTGPTWTAGDCAMLGVEQDRDRCEGDFVCPADPSCDCGGMQARCIDGTLYYERECRLYCGADGGVPDGGSA